MSSFLSKVASVAAMCVLVSPSLEAGWFDDNFLPVQIDFNQGTISVNVPTPQQVPQQVQHAVETFPAAVEGAVRDLFNPAGATLAAAIRHSQAQARNGAQGVPQNIRGQLAGIVPDSILNDASWNSADQNSIDLANLTLLHNNDTAAVTLGNVIVFDRMEDGRDNWRLWAHELFHTIQYKSMGIELFAHTYVVSSGELEQQASDFANLVTTKVQQRQQSGATQPIRYSPASSFGDSSRYFQNIQSAMKRYAPASACLEIDDNGGAPLITNVCNTAVWVSSYVEVDRNTGQQYSGICTPGPHIVCQLEPATTRPVITPHHGCVAEVHFSFFADGFGATSDVWEGDCSDIQPPTQLGHSCCMFNGGRCGPFFNVSANPVGLECSCQYGNPAAAGEVCLP